jgi:hypothetical protein
LKGTFHFKQNKTKQIMAKGKKNKRQTPEKVTQHEEGKMETPRRGKGINEGDDEEEEMEHLDPEGMEYAEEDPDDDDNEEDVEDEKEKTAIPESLNEI